MYQTLRNEYEIKTGKKPPEKTPIQLNEGKQLMSDDEIIQKIKESQTKKFSTHKQTKKPWISYEYFHPGQWVNLSFDLNIFNIKIIYSPIKPLSVFFYFNTLNLI